MGTVIAICALFGLAVAVTLAALSRRAGRRRTAARLVVVGLVQVTRAHVLDAAVFGVATAVLLGWIAVSVFKRGERWAHRALLCGWIVVAMGVATSVFVFSRGLPLPGAGGAAGADAFGWQPVVVGLLAWGLGLWFGRSAGVATATPTVATVPAAAS